MRTTPLVQMALPPGAVVLLSPRPIFLGDSPDTSDVTKSGAEAYGAYQGAVAGAAVCTVTGVGAAAAYFCGALGGAIGAYLGGAVYDIASAAATWVGKSLTSALIGDTSASACTEPPCTVMLSDMTAPLCPTDVATVVHDYVYGGKIDQSIPTANLDAVLPPGAGPDRTLRDGLYSWLLLLAAAGSFSSCPSVEACKAYVRAKGIADPDAAEASMRAYLDQCTPNIIAPYFQGDLGNARQVMTSPQPIPSGSFYEALVAAQVLSANTAPTSLGQRAKAVRDRTTELRAVLDNVDSSLPVDASIGAVLSKCPSVTVACFQKNGYDAKALLPPGSPSGASCPAGSVLTPKGTCVKKASSGGGGGVLVAVVLAALVATGVAYSRGKL